MTTYPPSLFSSGVTPAKQALAFTETASGFPRKGVTVAQPLRGFHFFDFRLPWGGPAET
jgi:hypothetical protein